jgi:hypothetical protein
MKYKDFFLEELCEGENCNEYTGDTFSAPQPDFDRDSQYTTTGFQGTKIDMKGYNPEGLKRIEELSALIERNIPTSPDKWAKAKAAARSKFKVYPSAYANLWAAKKYKSMGGGWKKGKKK